MNPRFLDAAFAQWVPRYVAASNRIAGIRRPPSANEIAAHRGFFARRRIGPAHLLMLQSYICGRRIDDDARDRLLAFMTADSTPWETYLAFSASRPFGEGNGRCARALWMNWRIGEGFVPDADRIFDEVTTAFAPDETAERDDATGEASDHSILRHAVVDHPDVRLFIGSYVPVDVHDQRH